MVKLCCFAFLEELQEIVEALSVGRPIITTDAIGCREVIKNRKNGFKTKIKDVNSLFLAIKLFHEQSKKKNRNVKYARKFVSKKFNIDRVVKIYEKILIWQKNLKICVIGLGYVGLPLAIEFGKKFSTIGFDINKSRIQNLKFNFDENNEIKEKIFYQVNYYLFPRIIKKYMMQIFT